MSEDTLESHIIYGLKTILKWFFYMNIIMCTNNGYTPFLWYRGIYFVCSYALQRHPPAVLFI
jgi:hypothetical protein